MAPDDEALIAKAMLLGCKFSRSENPKNHLWYTGHGPSHPFDRHHVNMTGWFGWKDPVELARAYIAYHNEAFVA